MTTTRPLELGDVPRLAELVQANRAFLAPWEPLRDEKFFSVEGQRTLVEAALDHARHGLVVPRVIMDDDGAIVGRITLMAIERRGFQSSRLGYWVGADHNGRGLASKAVAEIKLVAFDQLGLHRIEAGALVHNVASQRVLERNGFARFGLAPAYLEINGRWQDHVMFQVLAPGTDA